MHIADIDQLAINGTSLLHHRSPLPKILLTLCLLASIILSKNLVVLAVLMGLVLVLLRVARVPLGQVLHLVAYPLVFSLLFSIMQFQHSFVLGLLVLLKAVGAGLTMLFLITTTSYVDIFGFFSLFMPALLVDVFLFTYRSLFILLEQIEHLLKSMKLRGGYRAYNPFFNLKGIAGALGVLIIRSFEMAERMYQIYTLRGYQGGIPINNHFWPFKPLDYGIILLGLITLTGTVISWNLL